MSHNNTDLSSLNLDSLEKVSSIKEKSEIPQNDFWDLLGKKHTLQVLRETPQGLYLQLDKSQEVLLPNRYIPLNTSLMDFLEVFVYLDNDERIIATTLEPLIQVGEVKVLTIKHTTSAGAFANWGIHRDLFIPFAEQNEKMIEGKQYPIIAYIDQVSGRITGSSKLNKHIGLLPPNYQPKDEVNALVIEKTEIGYKVIVDNFFWGMIYSSDFSEELTIGEEYKTYIIRIREDDKLDLSLSPLGYEGLEQTAKMILNTIYKEGGILKLGDKSSPIEIKNILGISKKQFKRATGILYKQKYITIGETFVKINESTNNE